MLEKDKVLEIVKSMPSRFSIDAQIEHFINQLEVLANLRKLQPITTQIIDTMPYVYDITTDVRYYQGLAKGLVQGIEQGIEQGVGQVVELNYQPLENFVFH